MRAQYRATPSAQADQATIIPLCDAEGRLVVTGGGVASDINNVSNIDNLEYIDTVDTVLEVEIVNQVTTLGQISTPVQITTHLTNILVSPTAKTVPTGTAEAIGVSTATVTGVVVQALTTNTVSVFIGAAGVTTATGLELPPGASMKIPVENINLVYCIAGTAAQTLRIMVE